MTREKAIKILSQYKNSCFGDAHHGGVISVSEIIELLSAQPEIIRCKDCKHYIPYEWMWDDISRNSDINDYSPDEIGCERLDIHCKPNGFCCLAERTEE